MNPLIWRRRSRIVAYIDLVLGAVGLFYGGLTSAHLAAEAANGSISNDEYECWYYWLLISLSVVILGSQALEVYAAIKLLKGTEIDADHNVAIKNSRFWRNCSVLCMVVIGTLNLILLKAKIKLIDVAVKLFRIYIVVRFLRELKSLQNVKKFIAK